MHSTFIYRIEGAIEFSIDSEVMKKMIRQHLIVGDNYTDSGWIDANFTEVHPLTLKHVHQYFITGKLCKERVTASKWFERGYWLFS